MGLSAVPAGARKRGVVAACSGGPDSVALVDLLARLAPELGLDLTVASLDHGLRPEAGAEVAAVGRLAESLVLPFAAGRVEPADYPRGRPSQEGARRLRLAFLEKVRRERGALFIALGHNADDQAETVLMRLLRGSGRTGLGGMALRQGRLLRPLLTVARREILAYLASRNLPFVQDPSNLNRRYLRVRARLEILPFLSKENPNIAATLARSAEIWRAEDQFLADLAEEKLKKLLLPPAAGEGIAPGGLILDASGLLDLPPALGRRVVRAALAKVKGDLRRFSADQVDEVLGLCLRPGKSLSLPGSIQARSLQGAGGGVRLEMAAPAGLERVVPVEVLLSGQGEYRLPAGRVLVVERVIGPDLLSLAKAEPAAAFLREEAVTWPLTARSPRPGDRISPLGLAGRQKLSDLFVNRKVSRRARGRAIVVEGRMGEEREILWVAGLAMSRLAALENDTKSAFRMRLTAQET